MVPSWTLCFISQKVITAKRGVWVSVALFGNVICPKCHPRVSCGILRQHYPCKVSPDSVVRHSSAAFSAQNAAEESMQKKATQAQMTCVAQTTIFKGTLPDLPYSLKLLSMIA